ncbi:angiotensin-converting enzyme-like isoform X1 [Amphibalanus amphitrite]|uniref:angiotensin-converting enzyme-like isoform X1 n=1 Tax=Amphibalanus amphitrite TaxID=1232801 RepID=UPI001C90C53F|nr:angiotensin-converting enzyme-like isoform X1 [Amphibalanus amphitrite]
MAAMRVVLTVLVTAAAAAARPQEADQPPAVEVQPKELAGDQSTYQVVPAEAEQDLETSARALLDLLEPQSQQQAQKQALAEWAYASNITAENEQAMLASRLEYARFEKDRWKQVTQVDWKSIKDENVKRQFKVLSKLGTAALPEDRLEKYDQLQSGMERTYSTARVCNLNGTSCDLSLEPDLSEIMANSRDPEELEHVWLAWRENTGKKMRNSYKEFVELINEAAELNGFSDGTELWLDVYDTADFQSQIARLWDQLTPLYEQLHAYVRGRLRQHYGEEVVSRDGPIPAHLLGNMWSQSWGNLLDICKPYPEKASVDVTPQMKAQGYTPLKMFQMSDEFFTSLGLIPMTPEFWNRSILEKPDDGRELVCHASAWDFYDGKDVRIKQCTVVTLEDLITAHHEMGHIEYFLQYAGQPQIFKTGANPGFHEAVGDTLALSVATPKHLKKIGLLEEVINDPEVDMNFLMSVALDKIAFLPFGYVMDKWRWGVFSGDISEDDLNCEWWKLRLGLQGIEPPQVRSEMDFDPGAKYHIPGNVPYIRYFVSFIIQFQFHKALCITANQYDPNDRARPLHQCDIYNNKEAGKKLAKMLSMGASKPWPDAMEAITGQREMDATALRDYFQPLEDWLKRENQENQEIIGWKTDEPVCTREPQPISTRGGGDHADDDDDDDDDDDNGVSAAAPLSTLLLLAAAATALFR